MLGGIMKSILIFIFMLGLFQLRAAEISKNDQATLSCLDSITKVQHTSVDKKTVYTKNNNLLWLDDEKMIIQDSERAYSFKIKLKSGLNIVSLANNKGRELETVCINKLGNVSYIDSYGEACLSQSKTKYFQSISYAKNSYESKDPISNKIFSRLNQLRISFKKNINRNKCDDYINTFQSCYKNFSLMQGENRIPNTEIRYLFVLKELRKTLLSQCQVAS